MRSGRRAGALALAVACLVTSSALAREPEPCGTKIDRDNVVACALRLSPEARSARLRVEAMRGREEAASTLLPSHPALSVELGKRTASAAEPESLIWTASLAQELEIGGQRGARLRAARAEVDRERKLAEAKAREIATAALDAYFEALAALEEKELADGLARIGEALVAAAKAREGAGLLAPIEADIAEASALRILQEGFASTRKLESLRTSLATRLGLAPEAPIEVEGELSPLALPQDLEGLVARALVDRPEIQAQEAERRAQEARASAFSRARIPNPTVSVFAESERPDELRFGLGLAFPIPLPAPLASTYRGEIAEASALAEQASAEVERLQNESRRDIHIAALDLASRRREVEAFPEDLIDRAQQSLDALAREVEAGRLPLRDALLAQESLISLLRAHIDARLELCRASVELLRRTSLPLSEVIP